MPGHHDHVHAVARGEAGVRIGEHIQLAAARAHLHQVGLQLLEQLVVRGDRHYRHAGVDQRQRAVLEFAGGVAFGVDVGNLLELERAFQGNGVQGAAAQEQGVLLVGEVQRQLVHGVIEFEGFLDHARKFDELADQAPLPFGVTAVVARECNRQQAQGHQLGGEGLGRGDADLVGDVADRERPQIPELAA